MADTAISALPAKAAPVAADIFPLLDSAASNANKRTTVGGVLALAGGRATFTVAASNAQTVVKNRSDYVCDGTADNVEIQAALDALDAAVQGGFINGGTVVLSEGDFNLAATVNVRKDHTALLGSGYATRIKMASGFTGTHLINCETAGLLKLYNLLLGWFTLDGANRAGPKNGIHFRAVQSDIQNFHIYSFTGDGILVEGDVNGATFRPQITNFDIHHCAQGINIGSGGTDGVITLGEVHDTTSHGINFSGAAWRIENVMPWGCNGAGILVNGARCLITGCKIEQCNDGIRFTSGSEIVVTGNLFGSNSAMGQTNIGDDLAFAGSGGAPDYVTISGNNFNGLIYAGEAAKYAIDYGSGNHTLVVGNNFLPTYGTAVLNNAVGANNTRLLLRSNMGLADN